MQVMGRVSSWVLAGLLCMSMSISARAQIIINYAESGSPPEAGLELLQEEPHDLIFFKQSAGGGWVKAHLISFPGRTPPSKPTGALKFQVVSIEGRDFAAKWNEIENIDLWEQRLERETKERISKGDFAGAYPFLSILIRDYPNRPGLREMRSDFLWNNAIDYAGKQNRNAALAMLEELRRYDPSYKRSSVIRAIDATLNQLLGAMIQEGKLDLAQQVLARLEEDFVGERISSIPKWNAEFLKMAMDKRKKALDALQRKDYRAARRFSRESVYLKPDIEGGKQLIEKIETIYPLVNVGVLQSASVFDPTRLDNWAARRAGRLVYRTLFEITEAGSEGGEYDFLFGSAEVSPTRMELDLFLEPEKLRPPLDKANGFFVADVLAARAKLDSPYYYSPWAAAIDSIGLDGPKHVKCLLRRPHVLPNCLLQITVDGSWLGGEKGSPTGDYRNESVSDDEARFVLVKKPETDTKPREIVEVRCESGNDAVSKLVQGRVDVLDQLFPADAIRLQDSRKIKVGTYPLPSVHMLVPCSDHEFMAQRTFRRALLYGIDRENILKGELLENLESDACQVVSGPFPAGLDANDPLGYGYDRKVKPRRYEPSLAQLLLAMNKNQMKAAAERKNLPEPVEKPIRLAYPKSNLARVACDAIRTQWQLLGLEVEMVELPTGRTFPDEGTADIVYISAAVWEPIIDARRLLGPEGLAASNDQMVGLGLRRLEEAKTWGSVAEALKEVHLITNNELPILPLWQMVDFYAHRVDLLGVGTDIVSLYQNAENWRFE